LKPLSGDGLQPRSFCSYRQAYDRPPGSAGFARAPLIVPVGLDAHQAPQGKPTARQARTDGPDRYPEHCTHFGVGHAFQTDEKDHRTLIHGELAEHAVEIAQFETLLLIGWLA
jgi:hypothetical protein